MKKNLLFLLLFALIVSLHAQDTKKVFGSLNIGWYGMDFTEAKMLGFGDESPTKIKDEYFRAWNDVAIDIDMAKVFQKNTAFKDPNGITKMNLARPTENLKADEDVDFTPEFIAEMIKKTPVGHKKEGLGVTFLVQSFNKTSQVATVHVVFFDIANSSVLWSKKMTAKAGGGDNKKAWAAAMRDLFTQIQKKEFDNWRKEANY
ncbi:MAG: hypothetical protein IPP77_13975 [Bacteroidetes bacterium]|nr:hypothetical protein [Bacteroidota bacterium]